MNKPKLDRAIIRVNLRLPPYLPVPLLAAVLLLAWFTVPTFVSLNTVWSNSYYYSHGHLVLGITAVLIFLELRRAPMGPWNPSSAGFAALLSLVLVTIAARAMTVETIAQMALPAYFVAAVWALAGWANARRLILPLGYLYVAIPMWGILIEPLRRLTVGVVTSWIHTAGMPAFIEGNFIHVPSGTFEVMEGCAGLRYVLVTLALTALVGLTSYRRWAPALLLTVSGLALVSLANWLRVFITVAAGLSPVGLFSTFVRDHHTLFGWLMFVMFMLPLAYINHLLERRAHVASAQDSSARDPATALPYRSHVAYGACAVLALGVLLTTRLEQPALSAATELALPDVDGWTRAAGWQDPRLSEFDRHAVRASGVYEDGRARVGVFVASVVQQSEDREITSIADEVAGKFGRVVDANKVEQVTSTSGSALPFQELEVYGPGANRRLVWLGLRVGGIAATSDFETKVLQLRGMISGRSDAQTLVLDARCAPDCAEARSWLFRFAASAAQQLYEQAERLVLPADAGTT